jgi:hypothetical protein
MGVEFTGMAILGVKVTAETFFHTEKKTGGGKRACDHQIPQGSKFCPECGKPRRGRTYTYTDYKVRDEWKDRLDVEAFEDEGMSAFWENRIEGCDLDVLEANEEWFVGTQLCRFDAKRGGQPEDDEFDLDELVADAAEIEQQLQKIGLKKGVKLFIRNDAR